MKVCRRCGSTYLGEANFCGLDGERLHSGDRDPLLGSIVDRYRVLEVLGIGGMARVYRAEHVHLGQSVALKVLLGDVGSDRRCADRFLREARSAAQIHHPNVVEVRDFGVTPSGLSFMSMELIEGTTLDEHCRSRRLSRDEILRIARQTALGLAAAHRLGFVHRDLKPKNLMIAAGLKVKILDFGLVRLVEPEDSRLTVLGQVMGSPAYMAPEQILDGPIDARTDLYSLGVILYELWYGRRPFDGDRGELVGQHLGAIPAVEDRSAFGALVRSMMAKTPAERPLSAEAVVAALDEISSQDDVEAAPAARRSIEAASLEAMMAGAKPVWPTRALMFAGLLAAAAFYPHYAPHAKAAAASLVQFTGWSQAEKLEEDTPELLAQSAAPPAPETPETTRASRPEPAKKTARATRANAAEPRKNGAKPASPTSKLLPRLPSKRSKPSDEAFLSEDAAAIEEDPDEPPETPPIAPQPPALTSTPAAALQQVDTASATRAALGLVTADTSQHTPAHTSDHNAPDTPQASAGNP